MENEENLRAVTCCFSGHRPAKLPSGWLQDASACGPLRQALKNEIIKIYDKGYRRFVSGMAQGIDTWAAQEVLDLRKQGHDIKLIAALPCPNQDSRWPEAARHRFHELLSQSDEIHTICDSYSPLCMGARNLWMVRHSSVLITIFDGSRGGTANTIAHAEKFGLQIVRIDPTVFNEI